MNRKKRFVRLKNAAAQELTEMRKREKELINAKENAERNNQVKSEFLLRVSQEMRAPMNTIMSMTNIARTAIGPESKDEYFEKINSTSRHLMRIIDDVLDLTEIENGTFRLINAEFAFRHMINGVVDDANIYTVEKRQSLSVDIDPALPEIISGDEYYLSQVIVNLLANASKFTPEKDSIRLRAFIREKYDDDEFMLQIEVTDTGAGISDEQQANLFTSFEKFDIGLDRKFDGIGLGLIISRNIIELMGGSIWVKSEPGKGSTFSFTIKTRKNKTASAETETQNDIEPDFSGLLDIFEDEISFEGKTALLVEDVEMNREIVMTALENTRINIECAENGREAVDLFKAAPEKYDIILMDINMPEMDGLTATRVIRSLGIPEGTHVPIIALTANVLPKDVKDCLSAGMNDHIGKPIDFDELLNKIAKYIK